MDFIYKDIESLATPVGTFLVTDGEKRLRFSVAKNGLSSPYSYDLPDNGEIQTETNYDIVIDTNTLETGKIYRIIFTSGKWNYCDSDEHTVCFSSIIDDWIVGIGAFDPNDFEKTKQQFEYSERIGTLKQHIRTEPEHYDESKFSEFTVEALNNCNGFEFKLIDRMIPYVWFKVAWIQITKYASEDYQSALGLWLC